MDMAKKNRAAVTLGRRGGKKKVPKGLSMLTPERRREIAQAGARARWQKKSEGQDPANQPQDDGPKS